MSLRFLPFLLLISTLCAAQQVREKFDRLLLGENFDSSSARWSVISNVDNLLIVQEGEYIMHRKATFSPYAVMADLPAALSEYRLVASIKLDKTSAADGSIGVLFMAQPDGKGGFIFEINKDQKYRLRKITGNSYRYVTGDASDGGWIKNEIVKGLNLPNLFELRTAGRKYDVFLNNNLLVSFDEPEYKSGNIGFIIGPGSKGKADFIYVFVKSGGTETIASEDEKQNESSQTDILALAESIITLKTQINKLQEENDDLKNIIAAFRSGEKDQEAAKEKLNKKISLLEQQLKGSAHSVDSVAKVNAELMKYKEMVKGNDNGDLVINLSRNLKNELTANEALRAANKALSDSLMLMKSQLKEKPQQQKQQPKAEENQSRTEFVLPNEK
jgi:hypothetical protein